jgi:hypothetical protein
MSFIKDLLKVLMGHKKHHYSSSDYHYRPMNKNHDYHHYSSSDHYHHRPSQHGHSSYGSSHYKRKHKSRSFFSSGGFFSS